jgi:hypothetical protein
MIATLMSGYCRTNFASFGQRIVLTALIAGRDPNGAGGLVPELAQGLKLGVDLLEARTHGAEQAFARLGR